ncbi:MAG: ferritin [Ruminococcaceae bacterium]|nr:ferritin [Oscillospiraceae bacterium]
MKEKTVKLMNEQINKELFSGYLYLSFANYFVEQGLMGFANWYTIQAQEERDHAMMILNYLQTNGEPVVLEAIEKPENSWADALTVLKEGLAHEKFITDSINVIYDAASKDKDYRTVQFLNWFVTEQGEEEENAQELIQKYQLFAKDSVGLYLLNQELAGRVYTAPAVAAD